MRFVLRCALGAIAVTGVTLVAACQSASTGAPAPAPSVAPTSTTTVALPATTTVPITTRPATATVATARIYLVDVNNQKSIVPHSIALSGDSTLYVDKVKWTSWTFTGATGNGVMLIDDCVPDCARGHQSQYPVTIHLTKPVQAQCGPVWSSEAFVFTGPVPSETPTFLHRNGAAEWDLAPLASDNRC